MDIVAVYALDMKVLAVAVKRIEGTWSAYVGAVPGKRHEDEKQSVAHNGTKLDATIARAIFRHCEFAQDPYAR